MQIFKRPDEPNEFSSAVKDKQEEIEKHFSVPSNLRVGDKPEFTPKWSDYKSTFAKSQNGKCGFCEMPVTGGQDGDVEHFYPKARICELKTDPNTWGKEREWLSTVEGREWNVLSEEGYWWLAYDWTNYLLSCLVCNRYWKRNFFPVKNNPRANPPTKMAIETPLLLNPFNDQINPSNHLKFDKYGQIELLDGSLYGFETIRTCGLDRESLRRNRLEKAIRAYELINDLRQATDESEIRKILSDFHKLGNKSTVHSGMVKIIFESFSGLSWNESKKIIE